MQEASRLASSIYSNNSTTTNLSGKPSASPLLPRRAETFSGFDKDQKPKIKEIDFCDGGEREISIETTENSSALNNKSSGNQKNPGVRYRQCLVGYHLIPLRKTNSSIT